jgi:hypothetical protein
MRFHSLIEITWREMLDNVELFVNNLMMGYVKLDFIKLGEKGPVYADELEHNIKEHMYDDYSFAEDEDYRPEYVTWLHDFIIKARTHGALEEEFHDKTSEDRIKELEEELRRVKKEKISLSRSICGKGKIILG